MFNLIVPKAVLVTLCVCFQVLGATKGDKPLLDKNNSVDKEWQNEAIRLSNERLKLINELIIRLRQERETELKVVTCYLLGEYRATEAVNDLLEVITLQSSIEQDNEVNRLPLWGKYPAHEALIKIGIPAIPLILAKLETESNLLAMRLEVHVVHMVYGKELAKVVLGQAITLQMDDSKAKRLKLAIQLLEYSPYCELPEGIKSKISEIFNGK
jgi:hypothetical protein